MVLSHLIIAFFSILSATAQQKITLSGKVVDEKSNQPLAYASISIVGKAIGTVTNARGEFDFHLAGEFINDSIIISHIGYKSYRNKIAALLNKSLSIALQPRPILLDEIVIHEKNLTAKEIVAKAVNQLTVNYSMKPYCLEGYFREIEEENGKYVLLTEAAVDLYDKNFNGKPQSGLQEAVEVREMRRSLHHGGQHNRGNIGISLTDLAENNDVRYNRGMLNFADNSYALDTITVYNDRPVYGITMANQIDSGMMYIDMDTFGFLKVSMERKSRDRSNRYYDNGFVKNKLRRGRVWFRYLVEFEMYDGKLYPRRMHESELNEFSNEKGTLIFSSIETLEFIVNNIIPNKENKQARQLKYGMMIKTGDYHPDFWKNYNTLKLTPLDERLIKDLEEEISLEEQFEKQNKSK